MAVDLSDDYLVVDGNEAVTLINRSNAGDNALAVTHAFRRALSYREQMASMGVQVRLETVYDVPMTLVSAYTWKPGDTLTDSLGNVLNIISANRDPMTAFISFIVYDPKIEFDLQHTIDVYRLEVDKDAAGAATFANETLKYEGIAARVQYARGGPGVAAGLIGEIENVTIYLGERLRFSNNDVIRWYDPDYQVLREFDIVSWSNPDRLDMVMQVETEVRP